MKYIRQFILSVIALLALSATAMAITINDGTISYTSFGTLNVSFGGSGIPNNAVATTTFTNPVGGGTVTLGLTATARYDNPTVTNNGAGTFFAPIGNDAGHGQPGYGQWNVDVYSSGIASGQSLIFFWDANPAAGNVLNQLNLAGFNINDSWNVGMGFLGGAGFNPNVAGTYGFGLGIIDNQTGALVGTMSQIEVNVGPAGAAGAPDGGTTIGLLAGAIGLLHFGRRFLAGTAAA